jgi:hypothetical protein
LSLDNNQIALTSFGTSVKMVLYTISMNFFTGNLMVLTSGAISHGHSANSSLRTEFQTPITSEDSAWSGLTLLRASFDAIAVHQPEESAGLFSIIPSYGTKYSTCSSLEKHSIHTTSASSPFRRGSCKSPSSRLSPATSAPDHCRTLPA